MSPPVHVLSVGGELLATVSLGVKDTLATVRERVLENHGRRPLHLLLGGTILEDCVPLLGMKGLEGGVELLAIFSREDLVLCALEDGVARLLDLETGEVVKAFRGAKGRMYKASVSPGGRRVVAACRKNCALVFDMASDAPETTLEHPDIVYSALFSRDGRRIMTCCFDGRSRVFDAASGALLVTFVANGGWEMHGAFLAGDRLAVTGSQDGVARLWAVDTAVCLRTFLGHSSIVRYVCVSQDEQRLLTTSNDSSVRLFDVATGTCERTLQLERMANASVFCPEGRRALCATDSHTAVLFDLETGDRLLTFKGHTGDVHSACFSLCGRLVLTAAYDGTVRVYDAETAACRREIFVRPSHGAGTHIHCLTFVGA